MGSSLKKGLGWPQVLFALFLFVVLGGIFTPIIFGPTCGGGTRTEALNNAKEIAGGLATFREEYGVYPCHETLELLRKKDGYEGEEYRIRDQDDANAYLAQLLVTEIIDSETYFYAAGVKGAVRGDDIIGSADKVLARGENSFVYIMTLNNKPLTDVKSITPLVMAPVKTKGEIPLFDGNPYADYYIYGAVDGSGKQGKISPTGLPLSKGRTHLFQTGTDSLFGDETPVVKYPLGF